MCKPFYNLRVRFAQCEMSQNKVARAAALDIKPEEYGKYFFDHGKAAG